MNTKILKEFKDLCEEVLRIRTKPGNMIEYAKCYAKVGLGMYDAEEIRIQILYILSNLSTWRGEKAKETKIMFRELHNRIIRIYINNNKLRP